MMVDFTVELEGIHGEIDKTNTIMSDNDGIIKITSLREFELPDEYNSVIAYAGDVNSQIITFQLPKSHEGHNLSECNYKQLKWKNLGNNIEGTSKLEITDAGDNKIASWVVPPEVFISAGAIEISISIYDTKDGKIAFSWNTPTFKGLSVGEAFSQVGEVTTTEYFPSKDEILIVNDETRIIVAPKGYNNVACNYGEKNVSKIYFQIKKKICGIEVNESNLNILVYYNNGISFGKQYNNKNLIEIKDNFAMNPEEEGLVTIIWTIPPWISHGELLNGTFSVAIMLESEDNRWISSPYKGLVIGESLYGNLEEDFEERPDFTIELAQTLDGNEEDKAPSVKAVNDGLDGKLDTPSFGGEQLVRYNAMTGAVAGLPFNNVAQAYAVPVRDANGNFKVGTPQADGDVTPKKWVEENAPAQIVASMNTIEGEGEEKKEYVLRLSLVNRKGEAIPDSETSIDLPLEMAFVGAELGKDEDGNDTVVFTLQNGEKLRVGLSEIFKGKVDKVNTKRILYGTGNNGEPVQRYISQTPSANAVPQYSSDGRLQANAPVEDLDCVNKETMEDGLAGKVTKPDIELAKVQWVFGQDRNGNPNAIAAEQGNQEWHLARYLKTDDTAANTDKKGTLAVTTPQKPLHAANKQYVDGKVEPIASDVAILFDALGGAIEYASIDSATNPVTVPSNVFPAATIDKIGTGIKTEVINEAFTEADPSEVTDGFSATCIEDGVYRLNGTFEDEPLQATFALISPIDTSEGEIIYVSAELLSGSIVDRDGNPSSVHIGIQPFSEYWTVGKQSTIVGWGSPISEFTINFQYESVSFIDAIVAIHIGKQKQTYGVPVASVKKGDETVYTVPEQIRALTYDPTNDLGKMPVYGLAMSDTVYNYLDLEKKQYVIKCAQNVYGEITGTNDTIDVSEYLTDEDGEITVAADDEILFADADGNSVGNTVPSTITYIVKKGVL